MTKNKTSQTVFEYVKKNPLMRTKEYEKYLRSKKCKVIEEGLVNDTCMYCHLIFPDDSHIGIYEQTVINDNDRMITIIRGCFTDNKKYFNKTRYTITDIDNVN